MIALGVARGLGRFAHRRAEYSALCQRPLIDAYRGTCFTLVGYNSGKYPMRGMTIGQLANTANVGVETIRYYQRRGLIEVPKRPLRGVRRYEHAIAMRLAFIRRAQEFGFT